MYGDDVEHADILPKSAISDFLQHVDYLADITGDPDLSEEARQEAGDMLDMYDSERIAELRVMAAAEDDAGFVSESYWQTYATERARDIYGEIVDTEYFNDEKYADDLTAEFTTYTYDGVTYYASA